MNIEMFKGRRGYQLPPTAPAPAPSLKPATAPAGPPTTNPIAPTTKPTPIARPTPCLILSVNLLIAVIFLIYASNGKPRV